jgi:hypothetical protein
MISKNEKMIITPDQIEKIIDLTIYFWHFSRYDNRDKKHIDLYFIDGKGNEEVVRVERASEDLTK